jgi:hypothetical protein
MPQIKRETIYKLDRMNELREKTHERLATNEEYDKRANKGIVSHTNY